MDVSSTVYVAVVYHVQLPLCCCLLSAVEGLRYTGAVEEWGTFLIETCYFDCEDR